MNPSGITKSAARRFAKAHRGTLYQGKPGDIIEMSDRFYIVARDGSFRFRGMRMTDKDRRKIKEFRKAHKK